MSNLFLMIISESNFKEDFTTFKKFSRNGRIEIHSKVDIGKNDFKDLMNISIEFAKTGKIVQILPKLHYKDERYKEIFCSLMGTKYEGKCPDLKIDDQFYEYEGFIIHNPKTNLSNMLNRGLKQSARVIIEDCNVTTNYLMRNINSRIRAGTDIKEIWLLKKNGSISLLYKNTEAKQ